MDRYSCVWLDDIFSSHSAVIKTGSRPSLGRYEVGMGMEEMRRKEDIVGTWGRGSGDRHNCV